MVVTDTNYLHVLDKSTQDVVAAVTAAISMGAGVGESVPIPKCLIPVTLCRKPAVPELTRIRRQFIKVSSLHPSCSDAAGTTKTFVEYLNAALSK